MKGSRPTDEQKKELLEEHFIYEVDMLCFSFNELIELKKQDFNKSGYAPTQGDKMFTNRTYSTPIVTSTIIGTVLTPPQYSGQKSHKNLRHAMLETFLLHARNLLEFFYKDDKSYHTDDALALDFFETESDWISLRPEITDSLKEIRPRAGKELAHLTYKRIFGDSTEKDWNTKYVADDLLNVVNKFLREVPSKYKGVRIGGLPERIKTYPNLQK